MTAVLVVLSAFCPGEADQYRAAAANATGNATANATADAETFSGSFTLDGLTYSVSDGKAKLTKGVNRTAVVIPETVASSDGVFPVTAIEAGAFNGMKNVRAVVIRSTALESVGAKAFTGIYSKARILVHSKCYSAYRALFKGKYTGKIIKKIPSVVSTSDTKYSYTEMKRDLEILSAYYNVEMTLMIYGRSEDGRNLYAVRFGKADAKKQMVVDGCMHAREYINAQVLSEKIEDIASALHSGKKVYKKKTMAQLLKNMCLYVIPMYNPDGVTISQYGPSGIKSAKLRKKIKKMPGVKNYRTSWKANARGVDLNRNLPRGWTKNRSTSVPSAAYYGGKKAGSESETQAFMKFMKSLPNVKLLLNYHCMGEVIYYNVNRHSKVKSQVNKAAVLTHKLTGYAYIRETDSGKTMSGCLSDYSDFTLKVPCITIETGRYICPVPHSQYKRIRKQTKNLIEAQLYRLR